MSVTGVAIGEVGCRTEHRYALLRRPTQNALVGDVAPQQIAAIVKPHRAFRPAALIVQTFKLGVGQGQAAKARVVKFVNIVAHKEVLA